MKDLVTERKKCNNKNLTYILGRVGCFCDSFLIQLLNINLHILQNSLLSTLLYLLSPAHTSLIDTRNFLKLRFHNQKCSIEYLILVENQIFSRISNYVTRKSGFLRYSNLTLINQLVNMEFIIDIYNPLLKRE